MQSIGRIGVLLPEITDPTDFELLRGIQTQAAALGYDVIVFSGIYNSQTEMLRDDYIKGLENIYTLTGKARLDGILYVAERFHNQATQQQIQQSLMQTDVPCLVLGEECPPFQNLTPRQQESIRHLTRHLIDEHGCKRLYFISGFPNHRSSEEREAGFRQAMHEAGLPVNESDIFYGHFWKDIPRKIGQQIADGTIEKPDGIVCASDAMALAVSQALIENGIRVPEDICVTGYDGSWDAWLSRPKITTVSGRDRQYGEDAVLTLYELMTGIPAGYSTAWQEVCYGESCGCSGKNGKAVESLIPERYFQSHILHSLERKQFFTSNLIDRLRSAESLTEWCKEVDQVGYILSGWHWLEVCLCKDWCADAENPAAFRQHGFSDEMLLALSKRRGINADSMYEYPTADLLPALSQPHEPQLLLITSLHTHGQFFGFLATAYDAPDDIQLDEFYINWCDAAANGLYAVQQRLNTAKMRAQIELLTVHDPETGLYNRRGLAEHLPEMMHTAKQRGTAAQIMLITYRENAHQAGYDTAQLLASALRHTAPETAVCARTQDKLFAMMFVPDSVNADEWLLRTEQRFRKLLGNPENPPVLVTSVLPLDFATLSATEQGIASASEGLLQQAAVSDGMDYKEQLARLRREIAAEPQRDWNIDDMARSVGISRSHMQRLYKQFFGTSCLEDIIESRMNRAKQLLTYTDLRIQEIAMQCGYNNESHFMRQFKSRCGMTAVQYRMQTKRGTPSP